MGTDKRQRQKEGRAMRIAAAEAAQKKSDQRALVLRVILVVVVVGAVVGGLFFVVGGDDGDETTATTVDPLAGSSTLDTTTTPTMASAAGLPCIAQTTPPAEGEPPVPVKEGEPPTELEIEDLTVGDGAEVTDPAQTVKVNYVGVACSTGVTFDSSYAGEPVEFPLEGVIPGWTEGLIGMKVGGQRLLGIPSELAYGSAGSPPAIAPDEALWFVVELLEVTDATTTDTGAPGETTVPSETTVPADAATSTTAAAGN